MFDDIIDKNIFHNILKLKENNINMDNKFISFYNEKEISDDEEEYDNENLLYLVDNLNNKIKFKDYLSKDLTKQVYDNGNRIIYKCMIKHIIEALNDNEIVFSENNRMVDNDRLKTFFNFESIKCDPIILGERIDKNSKYDIIDGQHRMIYLKNLLLSDNYQKNKILNEYIPLDIRVCYDESDFKKYVDSSNNRKNFSSDQLRIFKYPILRDLLNEECSYELFSASYIKINEEEFKNSLFKTKLFEDFNNTPEIIFNKIKKVNLFFKNMEDKSKLCPDRDLTKRSYAKEKNTAEKFNMYIGFDNKLRWITLLDDDESEWSDKWNIFFDNKKRKK